MNTTELVKVVAKQAEQTQLTTKAVIEATIDVILDTLKDGESVSLRNIGTFKSIDVDARDYRNPQTGETLHKDATKKPKFTFFKSVKDALDVTKQ